MTKIQYASIPLGDLEIIRSSKEEISKPFKPLFKLKLSKYNPYNKHRMKTVIVKIKLDKNPYIEEFITQNKIGLNKKDGYKIYLKGDTIYNLCSKEEAYLKVAEQLNYIDEINNLFN